MKAEFLAERIVKSDVELAVKRDYKLSNGSVVTLKLNTLFEMITFWDKDKQIGTSDRDFFRFMGHPSDYKYLLSYACVPESIRNMGLGRECIKFFAEATESSIYVRPESEEEREDGSDLPEGAIWFAEQMIDEGLIEGYDEDEYE